MAKAISIILLVKRLLLIVAAVFYLPNDQWGKCTILGKCVGDIFPPHPLLAKKNDWLKRRFFL